MRCSDVGRPRPPRPVSVRGGGAHVPGTTRSPTPLSLPLKQFGGPHAFHLSTPPHTSVEHNGALVVRMQNNSGGTNTTKLHPTNQCHPPHKTNNTPMPPVHTTSLSVSPLAHSLTLQLSPVPSYGTRKLCHGSPLLPLQKRFAPDCAWGTPPFPSPGFACNTGKKAVPPHHRERPDHLRALRCPPLTSPHTPCNNASAAL